MSKLTPPDSHHVNAASGWLELGNPAEASAELAKVASTHAHHPVVLELGWRICAAEHNWPDALAAARRLVQVHPEDATGWIHQSYCLHEMRRTREAFDLLAAIVRKFPRISTIPYNLACYACQMGDLEQTRNWLARAIKIRGKTDIKRAALADPDLRPIWEEIRKL